MNPNDPLSLRRVANGYIVQELSGEWKRDVAIPDELYVFHTLAELTTWLGQHYPEAEGAKDSSKFFIKDAISNKYFAGYGADHIAQWTDKGWACKFSYMENVRNIASRLGIVLIVDENDRVVSQ